MCGILGIVNNIKVNSKDFKKILKKIQHRGQESFGISYLDESNHLMIEKHKGMIDDCEINHFTSNFLIGHNRYSTSGKSKDSYSVDQCHLETQPFYGKNKCGEFVLVHNGNIPHYQKLMKQFNIEVPVNSDTEFLLRWFEKSQENNWLDILKTLLKSIKSAYCLIILTKDRLFVVRDSYGVRPLCIGYNETGWCVSSESCVLTHYNFLRDVRAGEILEINKEEIKTLHIEKINKKAHCLFEYVYFLNENSFSDDYQVSKLRYQFGEALAKQDQAIHFNLDNPIVVGSPSTGIPSGKGYADKMRYTYKQVLLKNNNIGRTFILENNKKRDNACKKKYYLNTDSIKDRNIILVDDSLVRGTTMTNLIKIFMENGAKSIHVRIAAPPIMNPCYFGVDIPTRTELIANHKSVKKNSIDDGVKQLIEADSLQYLNYDSIESIMKENFKHLCTGCFNGNYNGLLEW